MIDEFERVSGVNPSQSSHPLQITDLNTLMQLEDNNSIFTKQSTFSEMQKLKRLIERKPEMSLICNRCHSLKNIGKLIETERPNEFTPGVPLKLSDHVATFNRKEIIKNVFK